MIQSATGLILRTRPLTETSLIIHWLTPDFGRLATVARGARRPKSPFLGKLDLFYVADFSFSRSRHSDLHILREVTLREVNPALRRNLAGLRQGAYATALVEQVTETETPLPAIYELMMGFLNYLCEQAARPQTVLALELKLLRELGLEPDWVKTRLSPGAKKICRLLIRGDWHAGGRLKPTPDQVAELQDFLHGFMVYQLGRLPKGRSAALTVQDSE
ncbi:MAG TPA: DNA repair protein RecO [Candidatus Acidoferrales bacterium]|nr:DNA repair protein RecO [Candidatus Acidoferrales bacterium]